MELVFAADPHFHEAAGTSANGPDSRLQRQLKAASHVLEYAEINHAPIIWAGDIFHAKAGTVVPDFNEAYELLTGSSAHMFFIPGNHDMTNADGSRHTLKLLASGGLGRKVYDVPSSQVFDGDTLAVFVPFPMENGKFSLGKFATWMKKAHDIVKDKAKPKNILVSHVYTRELTEKHFGVATGISADELVTTFDLVFLGHHHVHDEVVCRNGRKVVSIGAPMQHTFSDAGQKRGFVTLNTDTLETKFHNIPSPAPFLKLSPAEAESISGVKGASIRTTAISKTQAGKIKTRLLALGAVNVAIEVQPKTAAARIHMAGCTNDSQIFQEYIKAAGGPIPGLDMKKLSRMAQKYLDPASATA